MPNWCDNRLAVSGPPVSVMEAVRLVEGPERKLDFERLLPTPRDLLDDAGQLTSDAPMRFPDWYSWRLEHWGVKWNASDVVRQGYGRTGKVRYRFFTPYGPPTEFLDHLSALYPRLTMRLTFEVEYLGDGRAEWRKGHRAVHEENVAV